MACKNLFCKSWPKFKKEYRRWTTGKEQPDPRARPEDWEVEIWIFQLKQGEGVTLHNSADLQNFIISGEGQMTKGTGYFWR